MTQHIIAAYLAIVVGLFPIVNPLGMAPIFLNFTTGSSKATRIKLASRIAVGGFALMAASLFVGSHILAFFGLTVAAVQVGGGMVVLYSGWRLLHQGDDTSARKKRSGLTDDMVLNSAFFPLTMPLTVGPGTISVAITLGAKGSEGALPILIGGLLGVATISLVIYFCYAYADRVLGRMGSMGIDIVVRLSAFVLLCIGVQIVWNGFSALSHLSH